MDSDDDYNSLSPPQERSPPGQHRRLKRLKKAIDVSTDLPTESMDEILSMQPPVDSSESQAVESPDGFIVGGELNPATDGFQNEEERKEAKKALDFDDGGEKFDALEYSNGFDAGDGSNVKMDGLKNGEERKETKRALDFDDASNEFDEKELGQTAEMEENLADLKIESSDKKRHRNKDSNGNKEKKKKTYRNDDDDGKPKSSASRKRREEKERKTHLQQLHVESQKLLRETRNAAFKPIPAVHKPISSVLEKIRQRKLEVLKKNVDQCSSCSVAENSGPLRGVIIKDDFDKASNGHTEIDKLATILQKQTAQCKSNSDDSFANELEEAATQSKDENAPSQMVLDVRSMHAFRAPVDDTQDLFCDSQTSEGNYDTLTDQNSSPLEEVLAPSLLAMNLKFDSAPQDDISSDEEDNDKENIDPDPDPDPDRVDYGHSSLKGDPVKTFVDEEAVEEDDSDNDMRFQENEEEDNEDFEELNDLIETDYEEKPIDNDMRNELHQKWLEQQDATGTDNLLQRLGCGPKLNGTTLLEMEKENDAADAEVVWDEDAEDLVKASVARINARKAKQMIPQMFSDKNDGYLSSDEEEAEKRLVKQQVLEKVEVQDMLVSPAEDEKSREVFGLIKKLNTMPDNKKKAKSSLFFDNMLTGGKTNGSSKSSFVGRKGSHSFSSSHKQGKSNVRSFIFGRDDSNSRSSLSVSEDSSDVILQETRPTRNTTSKFSSSQIRISTQVSKNASETASGASLFEILKRSSVHSSNVCNQDNLVGLMQTVFTSFKIPKKPMKSEGSI